VNKVLNIKSPAKVNLFLDVLGKRPDNYHELETVMQEVSLFDRLEIKEKSPGITIQTDCPDLPTDSRNIVYKAASLIRKRYRIKQGVQINISKRIPIGGGLGGGSSNAAYTLKGLNQLWKLGLSETELSLLAGKLGSDVPFFIYGKTALCKGRGEIVFPLSKTPYFHYIIVYPGFSVPTKNIYKNLKLHLTKPISNTNILVWAISQRSQRKPVVFNRLEKTAFTLYPALRKVKEGLINCGLQDVLLCGSGSCLLGIVQNGVEGNKVKQKIYKGKIIRKEHIYQVHSY
jgi:4-diphosphocytidyl-2-C-methyl-D-erythritol kinase